MKDNVVLLHGAGRSRYSMMRMAKALDREGYRVHNLGYPSRHAPIEILGEFVERQINDLEFNPKVNLHFVTHSLGGIVLRYLLKHERPPNLGRVVMLAPPNRGAYLADIFEHLSFYNWILGPVGRQIGTKPDSIPNTLGPADFEVGIIAGNRSITPVFSVMIPGADDGRIAVDNTRLAGMADFLVLPCIHPLIMNDKHVIQQSIHFLAHGCFDHAQPA
jgi:pimeloyl-ACP methyl ester carboxylesterase